MHFCFFFVQLAGAGLLAVGIWVKVDSGSILGLLQTLNNGPPELKQVLNVGYLLIAVGAVLLLLGFLGCCGAVRESKCMLLMVGLRYCSNITAGCNTSSINYSFLN